MFKPVACKDFPGWYEIPGFSKHAANRKGEILTKKTGNFTKGGDVGHYLKVSVYPDGAKEPRMEYVSHLILKAFQGPRPAGMVAMHKDDNKHNNKNNNLKWATQSDNIKLTYKNGLRKPANGYTVSKEGFFGKLFGKKESPKEPSIRFDVSDWISKNPSIDRDIEITLDRDVSKYLTNSTNSKNVKELLTADLNLWSKVVSRIMPDVKKEVNVLNQIETGLEATRRDPKIDWDEPSQILMTMTNNLKKSGAIDAKGNLRVDPLGVKEVINRLPSKLLGYDNDVLDQEGMSYSLRPRNNEAIDFLLSPGSYKDFLSLYKKYISLYEEIDNFVSANGSHLLDFSDPPIRSVTGEDSPLLTELAKLHDGAVTYLSFSDHVLLRLNGPMLVLENIFKQVAMKTK